MVETPVVPEVETAESPEPVIETDIFDISQPIFEWIRYYDGLAHVRARSECGEFTLDGLLDGYGNVLIPPMRGVEFCHTNCHSEGLISIRS